MKKTKQFLLAALLICSTSVFADDSFTWSGYMRGGQGYTTDFVNADSIKLRNMENLMGRFGNEFDEQFMSTMTKTWKDDKGQWAKYTLELQAFDKESVEWSTNMVEFGGLASLPKGSKIWAGQKGPFKEVDILDYFFEQKDAQFGKPMWGDFTHGTGIGYIGNNIDISLITKSDSGTDINGDWMPDTNKKTLNTVDIGYKIGDAGFGNGKIESRLTLSKETEDKNDNSKDSSASLLLQYNDDKFMGTLPGFASYRVQIGKGVSASNLNKNQVNNPDYKSMRVTMDGRLYKFPKWQINPVLLAEATDFNTDGKETEKVILAGVRAQNPINENVSMVYEAVINNIDNYNGNSTINGTQYKIAVGPTVQLFSNEWVRPVIRLTAAVIGGEKQVTGLDKDNEIRLGYEFETWF